MKPPRAASVSSHPAVGAPRAPAQRTVAARELPVGRKVFMQGDLEALELADVVQLLSNTRKSAVLLLRQPGASARILLDVGQVVDAQAGALRGEPALRVLLGWRRGAFVVHTLEGPVQRTVTRPTDRLLVDLLHERAQAQAAGAWPPGGA